MPDENMLLAAPNGAGLTEADEQPTFDFEELSWGDSLKLTEAQMIISEIKDVKKVQPEDMRNIYNAFIQITDYLAKITVTVPRKWLVKDAPDTLDFSEPASFGYLKQKYVAAMMEAFGKAQETEKNE